MKLIIFDFDGVLADSFDVFYPLIRDSMEHIGFSLTPEQYRNFFIGNVHQGFKDFINNEKKYSMFVKFRNNNYDKYYKVRLFPDVVDFLKKIEKDYTLTIASSGKQTSIFNLLEKNNADKMFALILATNGYTKEDMIREILTRSNAKPEEAIMITDTVGDIKIAKETGLKTMAVTWGFHSPELLKTAKPDYIINNFKKLEQILLTNL